MFTKWLIKQEIKWFFNQKRMTFGKMSVFSLHDSSHLAADPSSLCFGLLDLKPHFSFNSPGN